MDVVSTPDCLCRVSELTSGVRSGTLQKLGLQNLQGFIHGYTWSSFHRIELFPKGYEKCSDRKGNEMARGFMEPDGCSRG